MNKTIITASLLILCNSAIADCREDFDLFKVTATNMLPPEKRNALADIHLVVSKDIPGFKNTDGTSNAVTKEILLTCNEGDVTDSAIVAHEFGHLISNALKLGPSEWQANIFAAEIFFQSGRSSAAYLTILDQKCANGDHYFCERANAWRTGLMGG